MMASIRTQIEKLDAKMAELQQVVDPEGVEAEPIEIDIDDLGVEMPVVEDLPLVDDDLPFGDFGQKEEVAESVIEETVGEIVEEVAEEVAEEAVEEVQEEELVEESVAETEEEEVVEEQEETVVEQVGEDDDDDDLPGIFDVPETITVAMKASATAKPTINETLASDQAWRKDMPGTPVRDIRSAISLNDRVIFINLLFGEDAQAFVNTLSQINTMETLDQAVEYITASYPQWDMNSDLVYRFMMAVRRKVK